VQFQAIIDSSIHSSEKHRPQPIYEVINPFVHPQPAPCSLAHTCRIQTKSIEAIAARIGVLNRITYTYNTSPRFLVWVEEAWDMEHGHGHGVLRLRLLLPQPLQNTQDPFKFSLLFLPVASRTRPITPALSVLGAGSSSLVG
jgi:hypothetical protein